VTPAHVLKKLEVHNTLAQLKAIGQGMKVNVAPPAGFTKLLAAAAEPVASRGDVEVGAQMRVGVLRRRCRRPHQGVVGGDDRAGQASAAIHSPAFVDARVHRGPRCRIGDGRHVGNGAIRAADVLLP